MWTLQVRARVQNSRAGKDRGPGITACRAWMDRTVLVLSRRSQAQKSTYCRIPPTRSQEEAKLIQGAGGQARGYLSVSECGSGLHRDVGDAYTGKSPPNRMPEVDVLYHMCTLSLLRSDATHDNNRIVDVHLASLCPGPGTALFPVGPTSLLTNIFTAGIFSFIFQRGIQGSEKLRNTSKHT